MDEEHRFKGSLLCDDYAISDGACANSIASMMVAI